MDGIEFDSDDCVCIAHAAALPDSAVTIAVEGSIVAGSMVTPYCVCSIEYDTRRVHTVKGGGGWRRSPRRHRAGRDGRRRTCRQRRIG